MNVQTLIVTSSPQLQGKIPKIKRYFQVKQQISICEFINQNNPVIVTWLTTLVPQPVN